MTDVRAVHENRVLDLDRLADVTAVADGGGSAQVAIRSDLAVCADDDVPFDDHAGQDPGTTADLHASVDVKRRVDLGGTHVIRLGLEGLFVGSEQIPRAGELEGRGGHPGLTAAADPPDQHRALRGRQGRVIGTDERAQFRFVEPGQPVNDEGRRSGGRLGEVGRRQGGPLMIGERTIADHEVGERERSETGKQGRRE